MVEKNLSPGGTVVFAAVLAGGAAGYLFNPDLYRALYETFAGWGLGPGRVTALVCFVPFLAAATAVGFAYDFATGQGAFDRARPADQPE